MITLVKIVSCVVLVLIGLGVFLGLCQFLVFLILHFGCGEDQR